MIDTTAPEIRTAAPRAGAGLLAGAGVLAAPLFTVAAVAQAAVRDGYDITRHPVSMLALGGPGWVQTTSFVVTGLLSVAGAAGARRLLRGGRGRTWGPLLFLFIGVGLLVASVFEMDASDGFPVGTPDTPLTTMSGHMILHNVGGSLSFFSMIALCFVLAARFGAEGRTGWAVTGRVAGALFAVGLGWAMTGGEAGALTLFLGVAVAWNWIAAAVAILLRR
ncbi:DUF998 domain-containing protein [Dactylosporangium aurantiacum]|uniref:DUF998 domain-containing protein n=1 Tax=Dactylosporangium aurantiacum TaxID=35754 RepID=A0A9Q9ID07_9ACTN|nr:DUF998 domain-containing protein [Dactylosporangium aurantiacum]MDG6102740.1 DUF998 domain-containing protein [Dactylosporangium aurantiacum]UWZ53016.1 DUF998 domain-containing protein [Dactylosporangium aurantiacum]